MLCSILRMKNHKIMLCSILFSIFLSRNYGFELVDRELHDFELVESELHGFELVVVSRRRPEKKSRWRPLLVFFHRCGGRFRGPAFFADPEDHRLRHLHYGYCWGEGGWGRQRPL